MKINRNLLKLAVLLVALNDAGTGATNSAIPLIMAAMPTVAPSIIMLIVTLPALFVAITPLVYARSVEFVKKRSLLWIASILFLIGGVGPAFVLHNIWVVLMFRAILGIGCGILIPMSVDLVIDFYEGKERSTMLGFVSATVGISGIVFSMLGGYLAGIQWNYVYFSYLVAVVFLFIPLIFLPEPDRQAKLAADKAAHVSTKLNAGVYLHSAIFLVFFFLWYTAPTNAAIVLMGEGLAAPAQIGVIFSLLSIACLISFAFGPLVRTLKFAVMLPLSYALEAIGLYFCYSGHTLVMFTIGIIFMGFALGLGVPTTIAKVTTLVSYSAASKAISAAYFAMGIGGFIQPLVCSLFGASGVGRPLFYSGMIVAVIMAILVFLAEKAFPSEPPQAVSQAVPQ